MASDSRSPPADAIRQILEAWEASRAQLALLREQVEHATSLAQAKVQSNLLERDLDRAYRALGEAVWAEVSRGTLRIPASLASVREALEGLTRQVQAQRASLGELLSEGEALATKASEKKQGPASKTMASNPRKR